MWLWHFLCWNWSISTISKATRINLRNSNTLILASTRNQFTTTQVTASQLTPDFLRAPIELPPLRYQWGALVTILRLQARLNANYQILLSTKAPKRSQPNHFPLKRFLSLWISMEACRSENPQRSQRKLQQQRRLRLQARKRKQTQWSSFKKLKISKRALIPSPSTQWKMTKYMMTWFIHQRHIIKVLSKITSMRLDLQQPLSRCLYLESKDQINSTKSMSTVLISSKKREKNKTCTLN